MIVQVTLVPPLKPNLIIKPFLDFVTDQKISVTQGSQMGQIQSIQMPDLSATAVAQP